MTADSPRPEQPESRDRAGSLSPDEEDDEWVEPYWDVRVNRSGLTATLVGFEPPIVITAGDLETLRKKISDLMFRAMM
jgi:hypothetical protein